MTYPSRFYLLLFAQSPQRVGLIPAFLLLLDPVLIGSQTPVLLPFCIVLTQTVRMLVAWRSAMG